MTRTAPVVLLGLAVTLAAMTVALVVTGVLLHDSTTPLCSDPDTTIGECLLATWQNQQQLDLVWTIAATLAVGAAAAAVTSVLAHRRRG